MPDQSPKRGAIASPRHVLAAAVPYAPLIGAPSNLIVKPQQISMCGNDVHGDCVTAEEAFAKACNNPEIFISDNEVIAWATKHGVLEGAYLTQVMTWMQKNGFADGSVVYDDGPTFPLTGRTPAFCRAPFPGGPSRSASQRTRSRPPGTRQAVGQGGSARDFTAKLQPAKTTAFRFAATDHFLGWRNSLASRFPQESTEQSPATRCSRGIPLGSSTCPR